MSVSSKLHGKKLQGLDIPAGIRMLGNNEKTYLRMLGTYVAEARSTLDIIENVSQENIAGYRVKIHGIKGVSVSMFAMQVAKEAEKLEAAADSGDFNYIIENNQKFIDSTREFIDSIEQLLFEINNENPKPKRAKPDADTLNNLLTACKKYDSDEVDKAIEELEKYEYEHESGNELVAGLRENVNFMQFNEIIEKLSPNTPLF